MFETSRELIKEKYDPLSSFKVRNSNFYRAVDSHNNSRTEKSANKYFCSINKNQLILLSARSTHLMIRYWGSLLLGLLYFLSYIFEWAFLTVFCDPVPSFSQLPTCLLLGLAQCQFALYLGVFFAFLVQCTLTEKILKISLPHTNLETIQV